MKVVIACKGRSHLLDCARELQRFGHNIKFFTATPRKNFKKFGLKKGGISFTEVLAPLILFSIYLPSNFTRGLFSYALDLLTLVFMPRCEIFIAASPDFTWSMKYARKRYGAKVILDRGASHVEIYNDVSVKCGFKPMTKWYLNLDTSQYELADYIAVGSDYMKTGFISKGIDSTKLFVNPYGVSLNDFPLTQTKIIYDFIYVGRWSKRKGCQIIVEALKNTDYRFLHVGSIDDIDFPNNLINFTHIDHVHQSELYKYYGISKTFLFPSLDDGFGLVLCQAYACGLSIIASSNCGGSTMKRLLPDASDIVIMNQISSESLLESIDKLNKYSQNEMQDNHTKGLEIFSWDEYGRRLNKFLTYIAH